MQGRKEKACSLFFGFFSLQLISENTKISQSSTCRRRGRHCWTRCCRKHRNKNCFRPKMVVWWGSQRKRENRLFYLFKKNLVLIISVIPSLSLFSHPLLCLCPISQAPVAKVTDINSYDHRFSAPLITIYLCKPLCACVSKAGRDCNVCVWF